MNGIINIDEEAIEKLRDALQTAGEDYKFNLERLESLINEITTDDIKGKPATKLLEAYKANEENYKKIYETISRAEEYINNEKKEFMNMVDELEEELVK